MAQSTRKFKPGDLVPATTLESVTGGEFEIPDRTRLVHLQFRRFVDCPICNTHIAELRRRVREIEAAGIKEVIVFHSSAKSIRSYQKDVPFVLIGDPEKALYRDFGVEASLGFLSLKALGAGMRGIARGHFGMRQSGGPLGLPADFLIAPSGQIKAVKYGRHAYDQWSVDELIALAKGRRTAQLISDPVSAPEQVRQGASHVPHDVDPIQAHKKNEDAENQSRNS